jgi:hypothetical protein|tara:strand:- start:364 stop:585 length:222 start_codon:yes stop_codon:yes gene_type:complete
MVKLDEYIKGEFKKLDRGIIATPQDREYLESFAKANQGSMDILLMQMGINYGYKIALENIEEEINKLNTITDR